MRTIEEHIHAKINIRGSVEKILSKSEFSDWNKRRLIKFEIQVIRQLKTLNN